MRQIDARMEEEEREESENIEDSYIGECVIKTLMDPINAGSIPSSVNMGAENVYPSYKYDITEHIERDSLNSIEDWFIEYSEKTEYPDENVVRAEVFKYIDLEKKPNPIPSSLDEKSGTDENFSLAQNI